MTRTNKQEWIVFGGLVSMGAAARILLPDVPNFAPVAALALFSGYYFRSRLSAFAVPLAVMAISDWFIGTYDAWMMALVYGSLAFPAALGSPLRRWLKMESTTSPWAAATGLCGCSLGSSVLFFLVTNFGCWLRFDMYESTAAGLAQCYLQALPFFRYTLAGDVLFAVVLFGGYAWATQCVRASSPAPVTVE